MGEYRAGYYMDTGIATKVSKFIRVARTISKVATGFGSFYLALMFSKVVCKP